MTAEPACLGAGDLFMDPGRQREAVRVCGTCDCRGSCLTEAIDDIWVGEDGPEAFLVRGGLYPHEQVNLWKESLGGKLKGVVAAAVL